MSNRILFSGVFAAALALTVLATGAARGADLGAPYYNGPEDKVEFGSGWYIRGDLGVTRTPSISTNTPATPTASNITINPTAPTALVTSGSDFGYAADLGFGYRFNRWFRTEVTGDFLEPVSAKFNAGNGKIFCPTGVSYPKDASGNYITSDPTYASGGCTGTYTARLNSYDVMFNAYVDLGTWYNVTPYVGAGTGVSFGRYVTSSSYIQSNEVPYVNISYTDPAFGTTFTNNYNRTASGTYYNLAWALMAGVGIDVYDHTKLDIGYRYLNLGKINGVSNTLYSNEIRAGLRYMIDE
ncbi:MAG: outer membrane beta-barrel protein [Beijerinckiaceae bacterium]|nr:outer membrane beta-barrel protein [Beijerinckiaceae bacterium]